MKAQQERKQLQAVLEDAAVKQGEGAYESCVHVSMRKQLYGKDIGVCVCVVAAAGHATRRSMA
jgi:hypothetical protein